MIPQDNMAVRQQDYAVFLPALSSFYSFQIGKYQKGKGGRVPPSFQNGIDGLDFLDPDKGYFYYPWCLYSAGHAILEVGPEPKENMIRNRDPRSFVLGDSGGFQIGKGVWDGDWKDPNCPKAQNKRDIVLKWMDAYMNYGMVLDVPAWVANTERGRNATGITSYEEAALATRINNDYWMKHRTGACKLLNVIQGENHAESDDWYNRMKDYNDPKRYPGTHFNGWAMGGQNMCDIHLLLRRLVYMIRDGVLEEGLHDWMHFLGTSKLEWAVLLTDVQRAVRKHHNANFTASFDCSSPFFANAKGLVYDQLRIKNNGKWTYSMTPGADDKKYSTDTRLYGDVVRDDGLIKKFQDSHMSKHIAINDVCTYAPGDLNLIGKEGKTSWDTLSYAVQMSHNVWMHINAVLSANEEYARGKTPFMLRHQTTGVMARDIIDEVIANAGNQRSLDLIEEHSRYWLEIVGQRSNGWTGKKTINSLTQYNSLFE